MSSTSNAQNLLVNVFRPTYTYQAGVGYTPSLVVSNVDKVVSDTVIASNLVINDPGSNTYVGSNAGNAASNLRASSNNVAIGYNAGNGFSNTSNTVAVGYNALGGSLSNVSNTVAIGANTIGGGVNNIFIGHDTGTIGSNNIFIGAGQTPGNVSNQLRIGNSNNIAIASDLASKYVGINNVAPVVEFDVSGQTYFRNKVGIQIEAPSKSLEVNGETYSSIGFLAGRGSLTKPAFAFFADPSTGLYSPGNGYGSLVANGLPYMTFGAGTVNFHGRIVTDISGGGGGTTNTITLSNGFFRDTSLGSIMTDISEGNISTIGDMFTNNLIYSGSISNTNTNTRNVIGGVVLSNGDVSANTYNGPGGTANAPHYTFSDDRTTGLFFPGANMIGLTAGGTERVRISNANVGIGTSAPTTQLDVSGVMQVRGPAGTITFSNGVINAPVGINISGTPIVSSNGTFSNGATTSNSIGGVTLSNTNIAFAGTISNSTASTSNVIGGITLSNTNLTLAGTITGSTANTSNVIGGTTLSNSNLSNTGTTTTSNVLVGGYVRNALIPTQFDISGGNLGFVGRIVGSTANTSNVIGGVTLSNNNISNSGTIITGTGSNSVGGVTLNASNIVAGTGSNSIGGVTLSNTNLTLAGTITGSTANTSNVIGGIVLSNGVISNSDTAGTSWIGKVRIGPSPTYGIITDSTVYNALGGISLSNGTLDQVSNGFMSNVYIDVIRNSFATPSLLDMSGGNIGFAGRIAGSTANTSNVIGGVVLSNNAISNSGTHTSGNFLGTNTTSNIIGGVTLSNFDLSMSGIGRILGQSNVSNVIGGVVLSNNAISNSGTHTSSNFIGTSAASNSIGGVTLSNTNLTLAGTITGSTANTSNVIGGIVLSNGVISNSDTAGTSWIGKVRIGPSPTYGIITDATVYNTIGGISLSNGDLDQVSNGYMSNAYVDVFRTSIGNPSLLDISGGNIGFSGRLVGSTANTSNTLGGTTLSNGNISNTGTTTTSNVLVGGYLRNALTPTQFDISGGNIRFAGRIVGSTDNTSNSIGGVTLSSGNISNIGTITTGDGTNSVGGVTLELGAVFAASKSQFAPSFSFTSDMVSGIYSPGTSQIGFSTGGTAAMVLSNGNVGIRNTAPAYALDVTTAAAGTAALNLSSWFRFPVSNTLVVVASNNLNPTTSSFNGGSYNFSNPIISMDSNLMTFTSNNGTTGGNFVIKKSGIWSISVVYVSAAAQYVFVDVSTSDVASNAFGSNGSAVISFGGQNQGQVGNLNYVGYLPSNTGYYYKLRGGSNLSSIGTFSNRMTITFLGETPNVGGTFPF